MKFKFKPQTGVLVAGLLAAAYSEACYYQGTTAVCIASGTPVDQIWWNNPYTGFSKSITASADWTITSTKHLVVSGSGTYGGFQSDGGTIPDYCTGPVHFTDASGGTSSFNSWSYQSISPGGVGSAYAPSDAGIFEGTAGSPGC